MLVAMDAPSVAESLPETYRHVLDRIADLETAGFRREADLVRRDAITAYSKRWNQRCAVRLTNLATRADRVLAGRERPRMPRGSRRASLGIWFALAPARARHRLARRRLARRRTSDPGGMTMGHPAA
jgi:hypothetical protein